MTFEWCREAVLQRR